MVTEEEMEEHVTKKQNLRYDITPPLNDDEIMV